MAFTKSDEMSGLQAHSIYVENSSIVVFDMRLFSDFALCLPVLQVHQRTLSLETERDRDNLENASPLPVYG